MPKSRFLTYALDLFNIDSLFKSSTFEEIKLIELNNKCRPLSPQTMLIQSWEKFNTEFDQKATELIAVDDEGV